MLYKQIACRTKITEINSEPYLYMLQFLDYKPIHHPHPSIPPTSLHQCLLPTLDMILALFSLHPNLRFSCTKQCFKKVAVFTAMYLFHLAKYT